MRDEFKAIRKGFTWRDMYNALWHVATVRYVTADQLKRHFKDNLWRIKCGTSGKLDRFVEVGLLQKSDEDVYMATRRTVDFLKLELAIYKEEAREKQELDSFQEKEIRYNPDMIRLPGGVGKRDTLYNSEIFLQAIKRPDFFVLFSSSFNNSQGRLFLEPDGVMLLKNENKVKLVFLEIEREKPEWEEHLSGKKWKYEKMASDIATWDTWWKNRCKQLKINHCQQEDFGFVVWCVGKFKADWEGWSFGEDIDSFV